MPLSDVARRDPRPKEYEQVSLGDLTGYAASEYQGGVILLELVFDDEKVLRQQFAKDTFMQMLSEMRAAFCNG
jgi:hypothetical protein